MSDNEKNDGKGLSEHAYTCLKSANLAVSAAQTKLDNASKLVSSAASMSDSEKSAELVKIGAVLSEVHLELFRASNEFLHAGLERDLPFWVRAWQGFWRLVTSGFFFMIVGVGLILLAQHGMVGKHSSITFIWVVLGAAILLFGTGTLGMAKMDGTLPSGKWSASVAGGAGALALIIGAGFVWNHGDIKQAFLAQKNYFRIHVLPDFSGRKPIRLEDIYVSATSVNKPIPVVLENKYAEVFVPYPNGIKKGEVLAVAVSMTPKNLTENFAEQVIKIEFKEEGKLVASVDGGALVWQPEGSSPEGAAFKFKDGSYYFVFPPEEKQNSSSIDKHDIDVNPPPDGLQLAPVDISGT